MTATNNKDLLESIHDEYGGMVHQLCLGFMKGDADQANDLSQEVFINVWNSLPKFEGKSSHKTWIYRITVNTCLKYIRDKKQKEQVSIDQVHDLLTTSDQPHDQAEHLYMAIGQLKELDRLIIMMVLEGLDYGEIADVTGVTEGNLRVKIHRIKTQLKKILGNER